ncbi:hypothetical protein [Halorubrum aethiopicum]|uniref:hypothetical protein n=1 Tax=Halorubrum aethiopicum TaxID=1758255 RepID=UPI0012FF0A01|nr:hypothetical protein [Halorubrum aethiopicum]
MALSAAEYIERPFVDRFRSVVVAVSLGPFGAAVAVISYSPGGIAPSTAVVVADSIVPGPSIVKRSAARSGSPAAYVLNRSEVDSSRGVVTLAVATGVSEFDFVIERLVVSASATNLNSTLFPRVVKLGTLDRLEY